MSIWTSKAGLRPRNKGVAVNLAVESMGRCQFGCRDYALGRQIDRSGSHGGSKPRSRHPIWHRNPARQIAFAIARLESGVFAPRLRLCGWRGSFRPTSISSACVCPGQEAALLKGAKGSTGLSLTIENRPPIREKSSLTIESASKTGVARPTMRQLTSPWHPILSLTRSRMPRKTKKPPRREVKFEWWTVGDSNPGPWD